MEVEGKGNVRPAPIPVTINRGEFESLVDAAMLRAELRGYARSSRRWCNGYVKNPVLAGLMGEAAAVKFFNGKLGRFGVRIEVDTVERAHGDGGIDMRIGGALIQVKTRGRSGRLLVRRIDEFGKVHSIPWQFCVATTWPEHDETNLTVTLDGWASSKRITNLGKLAPSPVGDHSNLVLLDEELQPMMSLVEYLKRKLGKAQRAS